MNENNNRVKSSFSETVFNNINASLDSLELSIKENMVGLTPEERKLLPKINVDNRVFCYWCY